MKQEFQSLCVTRYLQISRISNKSFYLYLWLSIKTIIIFYSFQIFLHFNCSLLPNKKYLFIQIEIFNKAECHCIMHSIYLNICNGSKYLKKHLRNPHSTLKILHILLHTISSKKHNFLLNAFTVQGKLEMSTHTFLQDFNLYFKCCFSTTYDPSNI